MEKSENKQPFWDRMDQVLEEAKYLASSADLYSIPFGYIELAIENKKADALGRIADALEHESLEDEWHDFYQKASGEK